MAENKIEYIGVSTETLKRMGSSVKARPTRTGLIGSVLVLVGLIMSGQMEMATAVQYAANLIAVLMGAGVAQ